MKKLIIAFLLLNYNICFPTQIVNSKIEEYGNKIIIDFVHDKKFNQYSEYFPKDTMKRILYANIDKNNKVIISVIFSLYTYDRYRGDFIYEIIPIGCFVGSGIASSKQKNCKFDFNGKNSFFIKANVKQVNGKLILKSNSEDYDIIKDQEEVYVLNKKPINVKITIDEKSPI